MRSVMVTKFVPYPADSGGKLRSLAVLRELAAVGEVVLCAFADSRSDQGHLERLGIDVRAVPYDGSMPRLATGLIHARSLAAARFWDHRLARVVDRATREAPTDLLQVEYSHLAPYLELGSARVRVLDLHNIESALASSYARGGLTVRASAVRIESRLLRRLEVRALSAADVVVVVSEQDSGRLPARPREVIVSPNGWTPQPPLPWPDRPVVAFVALMGWQPNEDAAMWLVNRVWPMVRAAVPAAELLLVGRDPGRRVRALAASDIEVTGTVEDVRPHLSRAQVALAPLLSGGGTRLKVLEALDAGRPVVATTVGIDGLAHLVGNGVVVADQPADFADAVVDLLLHPARAAVIGQRGASAVRETYEWSRVLRPWRDRVTVRDSGPPEEIRRWGPASS